MTVQERIDNLYREIKMKIQQEISEERKEGSKKSKQQLLTIMDEITKMSEIRNDKEFLPGYPRFIIDSWDFTDPLGIELINLFDIYKKLS